MLSLLSSDRQTFEVDEEVALRSQTIQHLVEDAGAESSIPMSNVSGQTLSKVIEFCRYHLEAEKHKTSADIVKSWDEAFLDVDQATLFDLILAANYMNVKDLLDLTCQAVADMIKGKTTEEIRQTFNIKNDFTPEEEEEVRRETQWVFE